MFKRKNKKVETDKGPRLKETPKIDILGPFLTLVRIAIEFMIVALVGLYTCIFLIPILTSSMAGALGITYDSDFLNVLILLVFPSLTACGMVLFFYIRFVQIFHAAMKRKFARILEKFRKKVV